MSKWSVESFHVNGNLFIYEINAISPYQYLRVFLYFCLEQYNLEDIEEYGFCQVNVILIIKVYKYILIIKLYNRNEYSSFYLSKYKYYQEAHALLNNSVSAFIVFFYH